MSHDVQAHIVGTVADVFAHRFTVRTASGVVLADVGPKGAETISLKAGDEVELSGEMKPSEIKVGRIAKAGGAAILIDHKKPHHSEHEDADPTPALRTVEANGFTALGQPHRKPKHFEILGRDKGGDLVELHVEMDGTLRKTKVIESDDHKWAAEIRGQGQSNPGL